MWPDIYFFAGYWTNRYWSPNSPGGGGSTDTQQITAFATVTPR